MPFKTANSQQKSVADSLV